MTKTLENLENSIHKLEFEKQNIPEFTKEYEDRKNALISQLEVISKDIEKNQGTQDRIKDDFDKKTQELQETQHLISFLLAKIGEINKFKMIASIAFAILVGAVILGFFGIAAMDSNVRSSIFSHESGIQFVTLFSLVIAIILFGILGILGGKERNPVDSSGSCGAR